jgi:CHRD domain-containing protein
VYTAAFRIQTRPQLQEETMQTLLSRSNVLFSALAAAMLAGCAGMGMSGGDMAVKLSGNQEVPAVNTGASGSGNIRVAADGSVSGSITTTGVQGVAAHIHEGAAGSNGPVIIPLVKTGDNTWSVPTGAKLTAEQMSSFKAGKLYVNVHSPANKGGEIRAQLQPTTSVAGQAASPSSGY